MGEDDAPILCQRTQACCYTTPYKNYLLIHTPAHTTTRLYLPRAVLIGAHRGGPVRSFYLLPPVHLPRYSPGLSRDSFVHFNVLLQKCLAARFISLPDAFASAVGDWNEHFGVKRDVDHTGDGGEPVMETEMEMEDFILFMFDLAVVWCPPELGYSTFLFFLGGIFLHVTKQTRVLRTAGGLKSIDHLQRLPAAFFDKLEAAAEGTVDAPTSRGGAAGGFEEHGGAGNPQVRFGPAAGLQTVDASAEQEVVPEASFEDWYEENFSDEVRTVLGVQRDLFALTKDPRALFLLPAPGLDNRDRIQNVLDVGFLGWERC